MFTLPTQLSAASKANIEAQLALFTTLGARAFDGAEKIIDLNLDFVRSSIEDSNATLRNLLSAKDPQQFFAVAAERSQPAADKVLGYSRNLISITSGLQAEFAKAAESQISETSSKVLQLVDDLTKNAPSGSEQAVAFVKSAIGNANAGYEQLSKSTQQAVETVNTKLDSAVTQLTQTAAAAAKTASKKSAV